MEQQEIKKILMNNGIEKNLAIVMSEIYAANGPGISVKEMIARTGIDQAIISRTTIKAYQRGWVSCTFDKNERKRPILRYHLAKPFSEIAQEIIHCRSEIIVAMLDDLKALQGVI